MMKDRIAARSVGVTQSSIRAMTRRVASVNGINLGQGTCELPPSSELLLEAKRAIESGHNSYTLFDGIPELKHSLVSRYQAYNDLSIDEENVLVTSGATGALECVCKAFLEAGDEVILFEPIYQYHLKLVKERSAIPKLVRLTQPDWNFDRTELERSFTSKTKLLIFANPNNPTGKMFSREELLAIGTACSQFGVPAVVDEVYEYIRFDENRHISLASLPGMFERTLTLSSASKTFFVTGWRVGWLIGPKSIMPYLGVKSDETYICAPSPFQHAVAHGLRFAPEFFENIGCLFDSRRIRLSRALIAAGFAPHVPQGAYYILAGYPDVGFVDDEDAVNRLVDACGIGAIPGSSFFEDVNCTGLLRFCFALSNDLLEQASDRLATLRWS